MNGTRFELEINKNEAIRNIKWKIQEKFEYHPDEQKLVFQGMLLKDESTVDQCYIYIW